MVVEREPSDVGIKKRLRKNNAEIFSLILILLADKHTHTRTNAYIARKLNYSSLIFLLFIRVSLWLVSYWSFSPLHKAPRHIFIPARPSIRD